MFENTLVLQAIQEVFNERFEEEMEELENEELHIFSEKHNKKMAKLIKNQKKPYFTLICTAGRRAACIVAAVIILSASALSVKAIREAVFDFIMKIFSDHTVVTTESGTDAGYPETIEEEYYISELPEGFEEVEYSKLDNSVIKSYSCNDRFIFFSQYTKSNYIDIFDNEESKYQKFYGDNDQIYLFISTDGSITYIWDNGEYIFVLTSNLDKETSIKLCNSTKIII